MGCIFSAGKLQKHNVNGASTDNVFHCTMHPPVPSVATAAGSALDGYLELDPHHLRFYAKDDGPRPTMVWALQHLRRYGREDDIFHFEAGRRCEHGEGIYSFRCQNTEELYQLFEQFIYSTTFLTNTADRRHAHTDVAAPLASAGRPSSGYLEPSTFGCVEPPPPLAAPQCGFDLIDSLPNISPVKPAVSGGGQSLSGLLEYDGKDTSRHTLGKCSASAFEQPRRALASCVSSPDCATLHHHYANFNASPPSPPPLILPPCYQNVDVPPHAGAVNYIVLDLNQQSSRSADAIGGSDSTTQPMSSLGRQAAADGATQLPRYSTIDFVKTYALLKSVAHTADRHDGHDAVEEPQHGVRKSHSISE